MQETLPYILRKKTALTKADTLSASICAQSPASSIPRKDTHTTHYISDFFENLNNDVNIENRPPT